ncbi:M28 family peptidase [Granulicella sp. 5B5]|uniref:M28 family peptidase n=1 Tax=Granulicella sp. 5B5 TaxID=1617967 RepID=UPI0015F75EED|nr:M28 family peptidase [Granulicella sp. 5B5]QMV17423.1 M28 family peptidase [Granulicella sp. 5B5]
MNLLRSGQAAVTAMALLLVSASPAQQQGGDKVDLDTLAQIKTEAYQHSQVMENLFYISEVYGPRITNSPNHRAAAEWAMKQMKDWGLKNVHIEEWGPFGYGWQIKKYYGALETPAYAALIGFPLAWTPSTNGPVTADAVFAPLHSKEDFAKYHGKLKGKIVLIFDPRELAMHTEPDAKRLTDEEIQARVNGNGFGGARRGRANAPKPGEYTPATLSTAAPTGRILRNEVNTFLKEEGALVAITPGYNGDGGTIFASYGGSQDPKDPVGPPMAAITPEQYNRVVRLIQHGITPKLTFDIQTEYQKKDLMGLNVVGEIPGTTKPDEVVMVGGHFDSWQGGTGATDNGTGSSVAMEAVRILTTLHKPMARTVRVALWGGEEEGLYGSLAYVQTHFAPRDTMVQTPEYKNLDVYFNDDSGSGRFRGVSALGNAELAEIFRSWIAPEAIKDSGLIAVTGLHQGPTLQPGGTDSTSFSWIGLDGIGFMQDPLEYGSRTHHSNMDLYDRVQKDDVEQGSMIEAWFAYNAATRPDMLPRIPTPEPTKK